MEVREGVRQDAVKNQHPILLKFAPAWKRALAFVIDIVLLELIVSFMFTIAFYNELLTIVKQNDFDLQIKLMLNFWNNHSFQKLIVDFIIQSSYFSLSWRSRGQTIGAIILKIVVMTMDKRRPNIIHGLVRYSILSLSSIAFYVPMIFIINPAYHQRST